MMGNYRHISCKKSTPYPRLSGFASLFFVILVVLKKLFLLGFWIFDIWWSKENDTRGMN